MFRYLCRPGVQLTSALTRMSRPEFMNIPAKGRTFSIQYNLPRLPVPPLEQTLNRYLETLKPILTDDQHEHTRKIVEQFKEKEGPKLQALLEQKARTEVNWLSEWWKEVAYLQPRVPVVVNVSPGVLFPRQDYRGVPGMLEFASNFIAGVLDYKKMLDEQSVPVDQLGGQPLCMSQYYAMLNACRVPHPTSDEHVMVSPNDPNQPRHINVIHNNHIFSVDVIGPNGQALAPSHIKQLLEEVVNMSQDQAHPVGLLTSMDRGAWGYVYSQMVKDITNRSSFINLQRSIMVVCLDGDYAPNKNKSEVDVAAAASLHGLGSKGHAGNRWYDKTLSYIFNPQGFCGLIYEHTSAEGPAVVAFSDHAMSYALQPPSLTTAPQEVAPPKQLAFNYKEKTEEVIKTGAEELDSVVDDLMLRTLWFTDFGKKFIKMQKLSPDAFIQVAFQLAYYRIYKEPCATYESGSLRRFQLGRTETIRSCSVASLSFCQAMMTEGVSDATRTEELRKAVAAHRKYTDQVVSGQGIDRHLLGLKLTALDNGLDIPQLFMDLAFKENVHFRLSTSQVASKFPMVLNFGPVVPDGYGICYNPQENQILLSITSYNNSPQTDSEKFIASLNQSFRDMQRVLQSQAKL